mgnify:CR=1 FL=1
MKGWKNLTKRKRVAVERYSQDLRFLFPGVRGGSTTPRQSKIRVVSDPLFAIVHWVGTDTKYGCPYVVCSKFDPETEQINEAVTCLLCRQRSRQIPMYFTIVRDLKEDTKPLVILPIPENLLQELEKSVDLEKIGNYVIVINARRSRDDPRRVLYKIEAKENPPKYPQEVYIEAEEMLNRLKEVLGLTTHLKKEEKKSDSVSPKQEAKEQKEQQIEDEFEEEEIDEDLEEDEPFPKPKSRKIEEDIIDEEDIEDIDDFEE